MKKKISVLFFIIGYFLSSGYGQNTETYRLHGVVKNNNVPLKDCQILVLENNTPMYNLKTALNGYYRVVLLTNKNYIIKFLKNGFVTNEIKLATHIPAGKSKELVSDLYIVNMKTTTNKNEKENFEFKIDPATGYLIAPKEEPIVVPVDSSAYLETIKELKKIKSRADNIIYNANKLMSYSTLHYDSVLLAAKEEAKIILSKKTVNPENTDSLKSEMKKDIYSKYFEKDSITKIIDKPKNKTNEENKNYTNINNVLSRETLELSDSLKILQSLLSMREDDLKTYRDDLKKAEQSQDSSEIFRLKSLINKLEPELELIKEEANVFKNEIALQDSEIKRQNTIILSVAIISGILLILVFILYMYYRNKKRTNKVLQEKNTVLEEQKKKIENQHAVITASNKSLQEKNIVLEKQKKKIENQHKMIMSSVKYAGRIQQAILPPKNQLDKYLNYFILFQPKNIVSGDFYWFSILENIKLNGKIKKVIFVAAVDCTGHGVPGAFMSMIGNRLLNEIIKEKKIIDPAEILTKLDEGIKLSLRQAETRNRDGMDLILCRIEEHENNKKRVVYSGAKRPLILSVGGDIKIVKGVRKSIGGTARKRSKVDFTNNEIILSKNDAMYLTSDGYTDQNNNERQRFGTENFIELLKKISDYTLEKQKEELETALFNFRNNAILRDDITVIGVKM